MATTTSRAINLNVTLGGKTLYATPTGLRPGRGRVIHPSHCYAELDKGQSRRIRKACRQAGFYNHASAKRAV